MSDTKPTVRRLYLAHRESGIPCRQNALRHSFISYRIALLEEEGRVALEAGTSP